MRRLAKIAATLLLIVIVLTGLWLTAGNWLHGRRLAAAMAGWEKAFGGTDQVLGQHPRREANPAALRAEELAARLGIPLAPRGGPGDGRSPVAPADAKAYQAIHESLDRYLKSEIARAGAAPEPPPAEVAAFLSERAPALAELRSHLVLGDTALWESDLERGVEAPLPSLLGHLRLQRLLLADALRSHLAGDADGALADLEASYRLGESLADRRELISQLTRLNLDRQRAAILRRLRAAPEPWSERLQPERHRDALRQSLALEARVLADAARTLRFANPRVRRLVVPYAKLFVARRLEAELAGPGNDIAAQPAGRLACTETPPLSDGASASGSALDMLEVPNLRLVSNRWRWLALDFELTRKVLALKAEQARTGSVPATLPGLEDSVCSDGHWVVQTTADGGWSLAFTPDPERSDDTQRIPARHHEPATPAPPLPEPAAAAAAGP